MIAIELTPHVGTFQTFFLYLSSDRSEIREPRLSVKTWMFETEKKGLFSLSFFLFRIYSMYYVDIYKNATISSLKLLRSFILFHNKTCRF